MSSEKLKLDCEGCGGSLVNTQNPEIYHCDNCDTSYKVKLTSGGIRVTKLQKKIDNIGEIIDLKEQRDFLLKYMKTAEKNIEENCSWIKRLGMGIVGFIGSIGVGTTLSLNNNNPAYFLITIGGIIITIWLVRNDSQECSSYKQSLKRYKQDISKINSKISKLKQE